MFDHDHTELFLDDHAVARRTNVEDPVEKDAGYAVRHTPHDDGV